MKTFFRCLFFCLCVCLHVLPTRCVIASDMSIVPKVALGVLTEMLGLFFLQVCIAFLNSKKNREGLKDIYASDLL